MIQEGQIYEAADPRDAGRQIRIVSYTSGHLKAQIVSHPSGKNQRPLGAKYLHAERLTGKGEPRRNGYFLAGGPGFTPSGDTPGA